MIKSKIIKARITIVEEKNHKSYVYAKHKCHLHFGSVYNVYIGSIRGGPILRIEHSRIDGTRSGPISDKWRIYKQNYNIVVDRIDTLEEAQNIVLNLLKQEYK